MRYKDITGQVFGELTVVSFEGIHPQQRSALWKATCNCGKEIITFGTALRSGHSKSCGCKKVQLEDLTNQVFGRLTVLRLGTLVNNKAYWECLCSCNNTTLVLASSLKIGNTLSCGCLRKELLKVYKSGKNCTFWKGGISTENELERKNTKYKEWRTQVFTRDNFTCQKCKIRGNDLHAHHIESFATNKALRTDLNNGICLCQPCHLTFHKLYGKTNNNSIQLNEYFT